MAEEKKGFLAKLKGKQPQHSSIRKNDSESTEEEKKE